MTGRVDFEYAGRFNDTVEIVGLGSCLFVKLLVLVAVLLVFLALRLLFVHSRLSQYDGHRWLGNRGLLLNLLCDLLSVLHGQFLLLL